MKRLLAMLLLISSCNITDPDTVFVMQQEDLPGTWFGVSKVESDVQPGYFYDQKVTVTIGPVDTSVYSIEKYLTDYYSGELKFLTVYVQPYKGKGYTSQAGYLFNRGDEYGSSLSYSFKSTTDGMESPITFTQFHSDSIRITFGTYNYSVGR